MLIAPLLVYPEPEMSRSRSKLLLCIVALLFVAACRNQGGANVTPEPTATSAARGEESPNGESTPAATQATGVTKTPPVDAAGVIYSVPFEVRPDGFSFRNYGAGFPEGRFTIDDLRAQFGDGVCSRIDPNGDVCIPTAEAQQWIDDRNADMSVGHCIGFTVASYRFTQGELDPRAFTPTASSPYDLERKAPIMRTIAANGALYWAKSVWSQEVSGTPQEIIDALIALKEPVDMGIYLPGLVGGHSLLAYGVEEVAPQQYHILVYDNNFPGEEAYVEVDYAANTWRYAHGAVNPDQAAVPYAGDATTETLRFIPLSAYDDVACPFCPPETDADEPIEAFTLLTFLGQGEVLVKTALGSIGYVAGEIVNEIPGAQFIFQRGQLAANDTPDIILPAGLDFTVQFNGLQRVSSLSQESSVVLDKLQPTSAENTLVIAPSTQAFAYRAGGEQAPLIKATVRQEEARLSVTLVGAQFSDGQGIAMGTTANGRALEIASQDSTVSDATLLITQLTKENEAIFATTGLQVEQNSRVTLNVADWDGSGNMEVFVDEDGDGVPDDTPATLQNQPLTQVIAQGNPGLVSDIVNNLSPFMGRDGLESILAQLAEQSLSGKEIGELLQPLNLTDEQLIGLLQLYSLPIPEKAELLFALRLEPERLDAVIEGLALAAEEEEALRSLLEDLALYQDIIADWHFLNTSEMGRLVELLNERALAVEQLVQLFRRMDLSGEQIAQVVVGLNLSPEDLAFLVEELDLTLPPTSTPAPTAAETITTTVTVSATVTVSGTLTATPTPSPTPTVTTTPLPGTPTVTASPNPYPGPLPSGTGTPGPYPYPGPSPEGYPGPQLSPTPSFLSEAFCVGSDLKVIAKETAWVDATGDVGIEIWSGGTLLTSGTMASDNEWFEATITGPGTWPELLIKSTVEPKQVPMGNITCPREN